MSIASRLDKLQAARNDNAIIVIWRYMGEIEEQAIARWRAEHPEKGDPDKLDARVFIMG